MTLDRKIIQEIEYPEVLDKDLIEEWADGIPIFSENDPKNPEWRSTPTFSLDLFSEGYGLVFIKNEADKESNPTQTIKDRAAWEITCLFRDYARVLNLKKKVGVITPTLSYITAGNVGRAISHAFKKYNLPPIKLLVDSSITEKRLEILKELHADIYLVDLNEKPLSTDDIKKLTNNQGGIDLTSIRILEPHAIFYDWHVHEVFNEGPDEIFVPYGSGRIMENYLTWQERSIRNDATGRRDPRLKIPLTKLIGISILGAAPQSKQSIADKLTNNFSPFTLFDDQDISALSILSFTGDNTGIYQIPEKRIKQAYEILSKYCATEPSAAAGLALYLQRFDQGKIDPRKKVLIVNTGKGI